MPDFPKHKDINANAQGQSKQVVIGQFTNEKGGIVNFGDVELVARLENAGQSNGIGILRTDDPAKTTEDWQGREEELEKLKGWLNDSNVHLLGIEAIGGMGKSTLAAKLYEDDALGFTKCYWADVTNGATFGEFARNVLGKFVQAIPEQEQLLGQALVQCLRQGKFLLIVDNLESLLTMDRQWTGKFWRDFFLDWKESSRNSKILVTSRERPAEPTFPRTWLSLGGLTEAAGIALLQAKGIQGNLAEFVNLVDGHPLLLTIVADLLLDEFRDPDVPPSLDYLDRLGMGNLRELMTKARGQHRKEMVGLAVVLDATFERLSEVQKKLFLAVSVLRQRFNASMARAVAGLELDTEKIAKELRQVVDKSLLGERRDAATLERWFEFQPVVLEYARYRAEKNQQAHQRVIQFYLGQTKIDKKAWQSLADVQEFLEIAHHWLQLGEIDQAFETVQQCDEFLRLRGCYTTQIEVYTPIIATYEDHEKPQHYLQYGASLTNVGNAYDSLGKYQRAIYFHQKSLDIFREISNRQGEATSLGNLGNAYLSLGEYQRAITFYKQQFCITREIGDRQGEATSLGNLGNAYQLLGQYEKAITFHQKSLDIARQICDRQGKATSYGNLGNAHNNLGGYQQAIFFHQKSLEIFREIGDRQGEASSYGNLGIAYQNLGEYQRAISFHQQQFCITREIGDRRGEGISLENMGEMLIALEEYDKAFECLEKARQIDRDIGFRLGEAGILKQLASWHFHQQQYSQALDYGEQALQLSQELKILLVKDCEELKQKVLDAMTLNTQDE